MSSFPYGSTGSAIVDQNLEASAYDVVRDVRNNLPTITEAAQVFRDAMDIVDQKADKTYSAPFAGTAVEDLIVAVQRHVVFIDMFPAGLQAAIDAVSAAGGGEVWFNRGQLVEVAYTPIVKQGVILNLNQGELKMTLTGGNAQGLKLRSNAHVIGGKITTISIDTGMVSAQAGVHGCLSVGPIYGSGGTPAAPSADEYATGWSIRNVRLNSNKYVWNGVNNHCTASIAGDVMTVTAIGAGGLWPGQKLSGIGIAPGTEIVEQTSGTISGTGTYKVNIPQATGVTAVTAKSYIGAAVVQVSGGASNGLIENVFIDDSPYILGGIHMDWAFLGDISSGPTGVAGRMTIRENMETNRDNFDDGLALTTHPNTITVRNAFIGNLTATYKGQDTGSFGIRTSGVYGVTYENISIGGVTNSAIVHTGGDLGFEFAPAAVKAMALQGNRFSRITVLNCGTASLLRSDSYADNVDLAVEANYTPMLDPLMVTDLVVENISGSSTGNAKAALRGIYVVQQRGGVIRDASVSGFVHGINVDEQVSGLTIERPHCYNNRSNGILVEHAVKPPKDILISDARLHDNGTDTANTLSAGLAIGSSSKVTVLRGKYGASGRYDRGQRIGVFIKSGALGTILRDLTIQSTREAVGFGILILTGEAYNQFGLLENVTYNEDGFISTKYGGLGCIPVKRSVNGNGAVVTEYLTNASATLIGLNVNHGDVIRFFDPAAAGYLGRVAVGSAAIDAGNLNVLTRRFGLIE